MGMTECETRVSAEMLQGADCVDREIISLLKMFYDIENPLLRQEIMEIMTYIPADEDSAMELLALVKQGLHRPEFGEIST